MSSWDFGALWDRGIVVIAAVLGYIWRVERRLGDDRRDIDMLKAQRSEDQHRVDKVLDDIRDEIRGLRNDIKALLTGR